MIHLLLHHLAQESLRKRSKKILGKIQQVVIVLKQYGAKTNVRDNNGETPAEYFKGKAKKLARRRYFI